jgi:PAS domain S-box-containing protein
VTTTGPPTSLPPAATADAARGAGGTSAALERLTGLATRLLTTGRPVTVRVQLVDATAGTASVPARLATVLATGAGPVAVRDATTDDRLADLPAVMSGDVGACVGVALHGSTGEVLGALCAWTAGTRAWSPHDVAVLDELAGAVVAQLEIQAIAGAFEASRVRWDIALDAAGVGSFDWELRTGRLDWDERMQALFGYLPGEFVPTIETGFERVHADDRPALDAAIAHAVATRGDFHSDFRVRWPDGELRWLSARGRVLGAADGEAARLLGTAQDVTAVRTARDEAARLLETMTTGFVAVDRSWRVTYLNGEGARVLGMTADELVGHDLWESFPGLEDTEFAAFYRRAMAGEPGEVEAYYAHLGGWFEVRAVPAADGVSLFFLEVSGRHADQERAAAAAARLELLTTVTTELADAGLDVEGAVARLAQLTCPVLADWCLVSLVVDGGRIRDVGAWHSDRSLQETLDLYVQERLKNRTDLGAVQQARDTREPVVIPSGVTDWVMPMLGTDLARQAWAELGTESIVVVPLSARDAMTGILTFCRGPERPPMTADEVATAREVGGRAAMALENARLYAEQRGLAEGLQRSLLTTPPEPDHCEIAVRYAPAAKVASVGGDWYDAFLQDDGATVLVIGDVMGHDTAAAAAMGQLRGLLRGIAWHSGAGPADVLTGLDAAMRGLQVSTTATGVVARLEQGSDEQAAGVTRLRWSNAGHPHPMTVGADGEVRVLSGDTPDLLLGIDAATPRSEHVVVLEPGSTVLLFTDGLIERRGQDLDVGTALLHEHLVELGRLPLEQLCDALLERLLPPDADDDAALVAVRLHPQDRPRPAEAGPNVVPPNVPAG